MNYVEDTDVRCIPCSLLEEFRFVSFHHWMRRHKCGKIVYLTSQTEGVRARMRTTTSPLSRLINYFRHAGRTPAKIIRSFELFSSISMPNEASPHMLLTYSVKQNRYLPFSSSALTTKNFYARNLFTEMWASWSDFQFTEHVHEQ